MLIEATRATACSMHKVHVPKALTVEEHHIVPQAWQRAWQPDGHTQQATVALAYERGTSPEEMGFKLWDPRTATLAPTCHRNVHYWLVKLMQSVHTEDPLDAYKAVGHRRSREFAMAYTAVCRWREAGGSLNALRDAGMFGWA